jgi:hypothetical protein
MELLKITDTDNLTFQKYISLYETIKTSGFVKNYTADAYRDMLNLYMKYVSPAHNFTHWCGDCRMQLVTRLYDWYNAQSIPDTSVVDIQQPSVMQDIETPVKKTRTRKKNKDGQ